MRQIVLILALLLTQTTLAAEFTVEWPTRCSGDGVESYFKTSARCPCEVKNGTGGANLLDTTTDGQVELVGPACGDGTLYACVAPQSGSEITRDMCVNDTDVTDRIVTVDPGEGVLDIEGFSGLTAETWYRFNAFFVQDDTGTYGFRPVYDTDANAPDFRTLASTASAEDPDYYLRSDATAGGDGLTWNTAWNDPDSAVNLPIGSDVCLGTDSDFGDDEWFPSFGGSSGDRTRIGTCYLDADNSNTPTWYNEGSGNGRGAKAKWTGRCVEGGDDGCIQFTEGHAAHSYIDLTDIAMDADDGGSGRRFLYVNGGIRSLRIIRADWQDTNGQTFGAVYIVGSSEEIIIQDSTIKDCGDNAVGDSQPYSGNNCFYFSQDVDYVLFDNNDLAEANHDIILTDGDYVGLFNNTIDGRHSDNVTLTNGGQRAFTLRQRNSGVGRHVVYKNIIIGGDALDNAQAYKQQSEDSTVLWNEIYQYNQQYVAQLGPCCGSDNSSNPTAPFNHNSSHVQNDFMALYHALNDFTSKRLNGSQGNDLPPPDSLMDYHTYKLNWVADNATSGTYMDYDLDPEWRTGNSRGSNRMIANGFEASDVSVDLEGAVTTIASAESSESSVFADNDTNTAKQCGTGIPISTASGAGSSSTSLTVPTTDTSHFFPRVTTPNTGYKMWDGISITIGGGSAVEVTAINYETGVMTLAAARTWSDGADVEYAGVSTGCQGIPPEVTDIGVQ